MLIYFTRYQLDKLIVMLNLYYGKLIGKIEEYEGKNYLMVDDFTLDNVLHEIKRVGLE